MQRSAWLQHGLVSFVAGDQVAPVTITFAKADQAYVLSRAQDGPVMIRVALDDAGFITEAVKAFSSINFKTGQKTAMSHRHSSVKNHVVRAGMMLEIEG